MDNTSCSCFVQSSEHCPIGKYIRVTKLHRSMMEHRLDGTGVYRSRHQILMLVSDNPSMSQKELARMYDASGTTTAVSLRKLEKGGHIRHLVDREDNRCNQICMTDRGRKVVGDSIKIFRCIEYRMFKGFSRNDMEVLGELLDWVYGNLNQEFTGRVQGEES